MFTLLLSFFGVILYWIISAGALLCSLGLIFSLFERPFSLKLALQMGAMAIACNTFVYFTIMNSPEDQHEYAEEIEYRAR